MASALWTHESSRGGRGYSVNVSGHSGFWSTVPVLYEKQVSGSRTWITNWDCPFSSILFSFCVQQHSTKSDLVPVHICILMHRPHCGCFYRVCCMSVSCGWIRKRSALWHGIMSGRCQIPQQYWWWSVCRLSSLQQLHMRWTDNQYKRTIPFYRYPVRIIQDVYQISRGLSISASTLSGLIYQCFGSSSRPVRSIIAIIGVNSTVSWNGYYSCYQAKYYY